MWERVFLGSIQHPFGTGLMMPATKSLGCLTAPTVLTLVRIAAAPVVVVLLLCPDPGARWGALGLFVAAAVTDWLDGWLARSRGLESELGRVLDPIADKILTGTLLLGLAAAGHLLLPALAAAVLILAREFAVSGMREYTGAHGGSLPVTRLAKWKTAAQMGAVGVLIVAPPLARPLGGYGGAFHWRDGLSANGVALHAIGTALLMVAAALTLITGWSYLRRTLDQLSGRASG